MGFIDIIPETSPKCLTSKTNFSEYLLIVDAHHKVKKLYGMDKIITKLVMDKLNKFQSRFGKIDKFGWWDIENISADSGKQFTST